MKLTDEQKTDMYGNCGICGQPLGTAAIHNCTTDASKAPKYYSQEAYESLLYSKQEWREKYEKLLQDSYETSRLAFNNVNRLMEQRNKANDECESLQEQLNQAIGLLKMSERFISAIMKFYGQGLQVTNWHQNGDAEPWDNFFDENMQGNELEEIQSFLSSLSQETEGKPNEYKN